MDAKYKWWSAVLVVTTTSFGTRFYNIEQPANVVWDESHFGKMGSHYINRTFFFDIHPPFGKMLVALSGVLSGYTGNFDFSSPGDNYPNNVNYVGMRMSCACAGALIPLFCFIIVWTTSKSLNASLLAAFLVILDTAILTVSRFILLDPYLLCFIMATTLAHMKFRTHSNQSFGFMWWMWLTCTGFLFALAVGVKFVGVFVIILIGLDTVRDLWALWGDLSVSKKKLLHHFLARTLCLIILPAVVYLAIFACHFHILENSGTGEGFYSSAFQSRLKGNPLYNASMPEDVAYGSIVSIKSDDFGRVYLHSHPHLYPDGVGARQQQVTGYSHKDGNNYWMVKVHGSALLDSREIKFVKSGDLVRLEHVTTRNNLHSHIMEAPITKHHYQVTCYGHSNGQGDSNDLFRLEVLNHSELNSENDGNRPERRHLKTLRSKFRLIHVNTGCALQSHSVVLPKWGFEQFEISCNPGVINHNSVWYVEQTFDKRLNNVSFHDMVPTFFQSLVESHAVMLQGNSGLKPKEGDVTSAPWQWPLNYRGQGKFYVGEYTIYMLGNPVIWWFCLTVLVSFILWACLTSIARKRGILKEQMDVTMKQCLWFLLGWFLHYVPFWLMNRVLYFHHYFGAFLFSAMLAATFTDYLLQKFQSYFVFPERFHDAMTIVLLAGFVHSFYLFSPLCYGIFRTPDGSLSNNMARLRWLSTWEY